ncbi:hypothetical protein PsAD2_00511 [Pseudovibrio axinellae]|uniref:Uncharacterized protein n=1 Tax=Pseudovibrio axinellae TaxID=989403 RepID=A0A166AK73_9HYPH|nr:hypothetical protein [Pseudovibrio axinellae]KZL21222.1 hypothetical protein PsAD2_00511 [Pseudovibrio axinellae]SEQ92535.1 hypothetical protein SAMN05421798_105134 [Pseudovibrio axinellae]
MRIPFVHIAIVATVMNMGSLGAASALELEGVKGVYTNKAGFTKSFGFCGNGKSAAGEDDFMVNNSYEVKDDLIRVSANGVFVFQMSDDGNALTAADEFTRQWAHAEPYTLDTKTTINCD